MSLSDKLSHRLTHRKIVRFYRQKNFEMVQLLCQQHIEECDRCIPTLELLAKALTNQKQHEEALSHWRYLQELQPNCLEYHVQMARALYNLEDHDNALIQCQQAVELGDSTVDLRNLQIRIYLKLGELENAEELMNMDLEEDGVSITSIRFAKIAYVMGRYGKAEKTCERILAKEPNHLEALALMGRIHTKRSEPELAIGFLERLSKVRPGDLDIQLRKARIHYNIGNIDDSFRACNLILERRPRSIMALELKGRILHRRREWPEAFQIFSLLKELEPKNRNIWLIYIKILYRLDRHEQAEKELAELEGKWNESAQEMLDLTLLHEELLKIEKARQMLDKALQSTNMKRTLTLNATQEYLKLGRLEMVHHLLEQAHQKGYSNFQLRNISKRFQAIVNDLHISKEQLEEAYEGLKVVTIYEMAIRALLNRAETVRTKALADLGGLVMVSSTLNRGGAERQVMLTLKGITGLESSFTSITLYHNQSSTLKDLEQTFQAELEELPIRIQDMERRNTKVLKRSSMKKNLEPWEDLLKHLPTNVKRRIETLFLEFKVQRPKVVHAWQDNINIIAGTAAVMAGVPRIVLSARSQRPDKKTLLHAINTQHTRASYRSLLEPANVTLCVNSKAAAQSYGQWLDWPPDHFPVIYNGIDFQAMVEVSSSMDLGPTFEKMGLDSSTFVIGGVFRLSEEKRPHLWLEVAVQVLAKAPDIHFVLVGGGAMLEEVRSAVSEMGLSHRIHLPGHTSTVGAWLKRMDLFLFTSRIEGLPNVLIEAQAFGLPVVTTDAGGSRETIIEGETGWVVDNDSVKELTEKLFWYHEEPNRIRKASSRAKEHALTQFSLQSMLSNLMPLYQTKKIQDQPKETNVP